MPFVWPSRVLRRALSLTPHSRTVLSSDPDTIMRASGEKVTAEIFSRYPFKVIDYIPEAIFHTLMVMSSDPDTT